MRETGKVLEPFAASWLLFEFFRGVRRPTAGLPGPACCER